MIAQVTQFADGSSGIGALGIDGKAFIIQLVTFVLAFWVLKRYAFKPILKMMDRRRQTIEDGVTLGEQMKQEQAKLEAKVEKTLHETRIKADGILADAQESGRQLIRDAEAKAQTKADGILAEAKERTKQDVARARRQLEAEVVSLVADATETIIGEKVDAKKDAALIDKALNKQVAA